MDDCRKELKMKVKTEILKSKYVSPEGERIKLAESLGNKLQEKVTKKKLPWQMASHLKSN